MFPLEFSDFFFVYAINSSINENPSFEEFLVKCRTYTIMGHFRAQGTHTNCVTVVMFKFRGNVSVGEYREGSYYRNVMR